jgi:phage gpG-like protein
MAVKLGMTAPNLKAIIAALAKAKEKLDTQLGPTATKATIYLLGLAQRNFKSSSPKQNDWEPLSPLTLFIRKHRAASPNAKALILSDKGLLRNANFPFVRAAGQEFGIVNSIKYAGDMNFGGTTKAQDILIRGFKRKNMKKKMKDYTMHLTGGRAIPARPFFPTSDEYMPGLMLIIRKYGRDSLGGLGGTA